MLRLALLSLGLAGMSVAAPAPQESATPEEGSGCSGSNSGPRNLIFSGPQYIGSATFDPTADPPTLEATKTDIPGGFISWLGLNGDTTYVNDEFSNILSIFQSADGAAPASVGTVEASTGLVHFEFNVDKTVLFGAGFTNGTVDVFTVAADGQLTKTQTIQSTGELGPNTERQSQPHVHQVVRDPSGEFFAFNDLGTDEVNVIGKKENGTYDIISKVRTTAPGCGPRHGAFFPVGASTATHYFLACEMGNIVEIFSVHYDDAGMTLKQTGKTHSTYPTEGEFALNDIGAAGELVLTPDNKHVYVSNRLTGNPTGSVAQFDVSGLTMEEQPDGGVVATITDVDLKLSNLVASGGTNPRMFSLSLDAQFLFLGNPNQNPTNDTKGMVAFKRDPETGHLEEVASLDLSVFDPNESDAGPNFIQEI